jgi:CRISPR-associated protein Cst1
MLSFTGHPFIDVGVAAITAFVGKRRPDEITPEDLEKVVKYIEQNYVRPPLRGYLTMAFTSNAWFIQDAFNPEKPGLSEEERTKRRATRDDWASRHLLQWQSQEASLDELCVFTGQPAIVTTLSGKLPSSRAGRAQIPLLQGDDAINFFTNGGAGLPISGLALLALQFFPLGCAKCGIGLLAIHSDNENLTYKITSKLLKQNINAITLAQAAGDDKLPKAPRSLKTLLIEILVEAERERSNTEEDQEPASLSAYNFNNGKDLDLAIYHLPFEIVRFLQLVHMVTFEHAWRQLVQRAWQLPSAKKGKKGEHEAIQEPRRNYLFEDLFSLPGDAPRFIRTYFLRIPRWSQNDDDPHRQYSLRSELDLISWSLVELFLKEVIHMDTIRIERICTLGDGLAFYVEKEGGKRFFRSFFTENNPSNFRTLLIKANIAHIRNGHPSLFDMETYIDVFEEGYEVMRPDWRLARDLVLMRMIDKLQQKWLPQNRDAIPEEELESDTEPEPIVNR